MKYLFFLLIVPSLCFSTLEVGVGQVPITPPLKSYSAGSFEREGGLESVHDPLFATAVVIRNETTCIALCSVDHLGFPHDMVEQVKQRVHAQKKGAQCEIYINSTHTHSGSGGYLNIGEMGEMIAGPYNPAIVQSTVEATAEAILKAAHHLQPAKIGLGYGTVDDLTTYAGVYPTDLAPPTDLMVMKVTTLEGSPLAAIFHYSLYPDLLTFGNESNLVFSADVVGYVRDHVQEMIGQGVVPLFLNGPKAELQAHLPHPDPFQSCDQIGKKLAEGVSTLWKSIVPEKTLEISTFHDIYTFYPQPTPGGYLIPLPPTPTEMHLIVFNKHYAWATIPADLSCSYAAIFKKHAQNWGFKQLSILDITNDAHGYVYSPMSWRLKPAEVEFSWGGEMYGQLIESKLISLLDRGHPL